MMVSANSASCVPAEPTVAGPEALEEALHVLVEPRPARSAAARRARARRRRPAATPAQPAISTPQAAACPAVGKNAASASATIIDRLSRIGAAAAAAKRSERIEDAAVERHQRHQQQIGKRDARELDREREAPRVVAEAGREQIDHRRREDQRDASSTIWLASSSVKMRSANSRAASAPPCCADARIGRHEGGVERALGEDRAEMVGQPERHEERVGDRPGAEHRRQHDVAQKAGDAREQRKPPTVRMRLIMTLEALRVREKGWRRT